jgi:hypothetical protein
MKNSDKPLRLTRKHLCDAIELAFEKKVPFTVTYPRYTLFVSTYRRPKTGGVTGIRITWSAPKGTTNGK